MIAVFLLQCRMRGAGDPEADGTCDVAPSRDADNAVEGSHQFVSVPWNRPFLDVFLGGPRLSCVKSWSH